jgi:hypothetical protein
MVGGMTEPRRCIHGRTERQACAKCNAADLADTQEVLAQTDIVLTELTARHTDLVAAARGYLEVHPCDGPQLRGCAADKALRAALIEDAAALDRANGAALDRHEKMTLKEEL